MKKAVLIAGISGMLFATVSCKKTTESIVNCLFETMSVKADIDPGNARLVNLSIDYSGTITVSSVAWDFGDGTITTGNARTTNHIYSKPGVYNIKATPTLTKGKSTCSKNLTTTVTVK